MPSAVETPVVTRLPRCNPRIITKEPGGGDSMLTPSATGPFEEPLTLLRTSFGIALGARLSCDLWKADEDVATCGGAAVEIASGVPLPIDR
jgi:hypothetical protein